MTFNMETQEYVSHAEWICFQERFARMYLELHRNIYYECTARHAAARAKGDEVAARFWSILASVEASAADVWDREWMRRDAMRRCCNETPCRDAECKRCNGRNSALASAK